MATLISLQWYKHILLDDLLLFRPISYPFRNDTNKHPTFHFTILYMPQHKVKNSQGKHKERHDTCLLSIVLVRDKAQAKNFRVYFLFLFYKISSISIENVTPTILALSLPKFNVYYSFSLQSSIFFLYTIINFNLKQHFIIYIAWM